MRSVRFRVEGRVQGVSFRAFTRKLAKELGLVGWVRNEPEGAVTGQVEGEDEAVAQLLETLRRGPPAARVDRLEVDEASPSGARDFSIRY